MILFLIQFLQKYTVHFPQVFFYTSTRMLLAAITALLFMIFVGPSFIRILKEKKIKQMIRQKEAPLLGELHHKKQHTPTMGGFLILLSMLLSLVLWMDLTSSITYLLLFVTLGLGVLGFFDDYLAIKRKNTKGVNPKKKLLFQLIIASCVAFYLLVPSVSAFFETKCALKPPIAKEMVGKKIHTLSTQEYNMRLYIPFFKKPFVFHSAIALGLLFFFYLFVIIGSSNAVNLTDGLDGLAAGVLIMVSVAFALIAFISNNFNLSSYLNILYIEQAGEIAIYLSAFAGAVLGFLWFNCHPATLFMGDIGSLTLGGILGTSAILLKREFLLAIFGAIFVIETLSVMMQVLYFRLTHGKRFFKCAPLHHHFEYKGLKETKVVVRFWIIALLFALFGLLTLKIQ